MNRSEIRNITNDRLLEWSETLIAAHATPFVLLGVGHDHASGEVHLCVPKGMPLVEVRLFVRHALNVLDGQLAAAGDQLQ